MRATVYPIAKSFDETLSMSFDWNDYPDEYPQWRDLTNDQQNELLSEFIKTHADDLFDMLEFIPPTAAECLAGTIMGDNESQAELRYLLSLAARGAYSTLIMDRAEQLCDNHWRQKEYV